MKEQIVQTIWALAQALSGALTQPGIDATGVAKAAGVELKLHKENDYVRFYESTRSLRLANGVVVGKLDVRESKDASKPPFVVISGLQGTCITVDEIRRQMSELTPPVPPSNSVPNATITREAKLAGHRMGLSFKWSNPDCLESIVPRMD